MFIELISILIPLLILIISCYIEIFENKKTKTALIIVDPQYDFCEGGSLEVKGSPEMIKEINYLRKYPNFDKVFITKDWHPDDHISFAINHNKEPFTKITHTINDHNNVITIEQDLWPKHCVAYTKGSEIHHELFVSPKDIIINKGTLKNIDSYSGFGDAFKNKFERTDLSYFLDFYRINNVVICGLATDYCVQATALDAVSKGYNVSIIKSTTKGVNEKTTEEAITRMNNRGIVFYETVDDYIDNQKN